MGLLDLYGAVCWALAPIIVLIVWACRDPEARRGPDDKLNWVGFSCAAIILAPAIPVSIVAIAPIAGYVALVRLANGRLYSWWINRRKPQPHQGESVEDFVARTRREMAEWEEELIRAAEEARQAEMDKGPEREV